MVVLHLKQMIPPIIGNVGGDQAVQGTGLVLDIATISSEKNIELSQEGLLTLGPTGGAQIILNPDGTTTAATGNISVSGGATFSTIYWYKWNLQWNFSCTNHIYLHWTGNIQWWYNCRWWCK